jgi:hypothetical protein
VSASGLALVPQISQENGALVMRYPRRTDAAARGLGYAVTFSENLDAFGPVAPTGFTTSAAPYVPAVPGYEEITATLQIDGEKRFMRVELTLAPGG